MFAHTMSSLLHLRPEGTTAATASGSARCSPNATLVAVGDAAGVLLVVDDPPPQPASATPAQSDATNVTNFKWCMSV
jgi:hypothetical protein